MAKDIQSWNPEDAQEWAASGKSTATRNLWISIPSLLCGFAVWLYWGIITVQMLNLGFPYAKSELFSLMAIAVMTVNNMKQLVQTPIKSFITPNVMGNTNPPSPPISPTIPPTEPTLSG